MEQMTDPRDCGSSLAFDKVYKKEIQVNMR